MKKENSFMKYFKVYLWLLGFLKPYKYTFAVVILFNVCITTVELSLPKVIGFFIDDIVPNKDLKLFAFIILILIVLLIIKFILGTIKSNLEIKVQEKAASDLQLTLFSHLRNLGFVYFEKTPIGELLSLMNKEVTAAQGVYRKYLPWTINGLIFSVISIILMFSTSFLLSLVIIPTLFIYYLIGPYFERRAAIYGKEMAKDSVSYNQKIYENIASISEIRAFSSENWSINRVLEKLYRSNNSMIKTYFYEYLRGTIRRSTYYLGAMLLFILGSYLIKQNTITIGEFVTFLLYYFATMQQVTSVITNFTEQKILMYQVEHLYEFISQKPKVIETDNPILIKEISGCITFENISFGYPGKPCVLKGFSLNIKPGEKIAIVGESGNGKSTLLKLLARFYDPIEGSILLDGIPISDLSFQELRNHIGYVFQETFLFGISIKENIRFGNPQATDSEVREVAKMAFAHEFIEKLPQGYETLIGERGIKLSGGEKQRIAIARMLIKNPKIILLDEATSALDTISELEIQKYLESFWGNKTIITVAHRLSTVRNYDKIIVLKNGNITEIGSYEKLVKQEGEFLKLLKGQEYNTSLPGGALHV